MKRSGENQFHKSMHTSEYASRLICEHCGKTHGTNLWPVNGDITPFYDTKQKSRYPYTLDVTCPFCHQEWYVGWEFDPGPTQPLTINPRESVVSHDLNMKLYEAAKAEDLGAVRQAIAEGADINFTRDLGDGHTLLHLAIAFEYAGEEVAKVLIESGADVNAQSCSGKTALHFAVEFKKMAILSALIDAGAEIGRSDYNGGTAVDYAKSGLPDTAEIYRILNEAAKSKGRSRTGDTKRRWWQWWATNDGYIPNFFPKTGYFSFHDRGDFPTSEDFLKFSRSLNKLKRYRSEFSFLYGNLRITVNFDNGTELQRFIIDLKRLLMKFGYTGGEFGENGDKLHGWSVCPHGKYNFDWEWGMGETACAACIQSRKV